jgi:ABC-type bacteriocin/lantibiotic exporter with double-glycine peptidase domain
VQIVSKIVTAAILYFGAELVIEGSLPVGELVAFNILAGRVSAPVLRLAQVWRDFHQARLSVLRLGDILNATAEPTYTAARARLPAIRGNIEFDHVTFRYRVDGQEVLHASISNGSSSDQRGRSRMWRREFVVGLAGAALWPVVARAQQGERARGS